MSWAILCESSDLAVQCLAAAEAIGLAVSTAVAEGAELREAALQKLAEHEPTAVVFLTEPALDDLVELSHAARTHAQPIAVALPAQSDETRVLLEVAGELGLCAVAELRPLVAALSLLGAGASDAHAAQARSLGPADRARLRGVLGSGGKGQLVNVDTLRVGYLAESATQPVALGEAADVRDALLALKRRERQEKEVVSSVDVDARAVLDVIFGPRRALSDPASKSALAPYGIPLPVEELCSSPSRAAAEASRIGFPVRLSLASPDLRIWDHPDLSVDMVDNAARVRDTFRQLIAAAQARFQADPKLAHGEQRILGALVTATSEPLALLGVRATALPRERVALRIGFADPHGRAARDETVTVLPAEQALIERALRRLSGAALLLETSPAQRKTRVDNVVDVLQRVAAFVNDRRREIEGVELRPLAVLLDGSVEVREACVRVSDWFERSNQ